MKNALCNRRWIFRRVSAYFAVAFFLGRLQLTGDVLKEPGRGRTVGGGVEGGGEGKWLGGEASGGTNVWFVVFVPL